MQRITSNKPSNKFTNFINFTSLPDDEAKELVNRLSEKIINAENDREFEIAQAEQAIRIWKNDFWTDEDKEFFRENFNVYPYQIPIARGPLNKLIANQRLNSYTFDVVPIDANSYDRQIQKREEYVKMFGDEFDTVEQAEEYFDRYYDDQYAEALSLYYAQIRNKNKTRFVESEAFENAVITGVDFLKVGYSRQYNPDGEIIEQRKSIRQMFWDRTSVDSMLTDVEYIGEVHRLYKQDLINMFPEHKEVLADRYEYYTSLTQNLSQETQSSWRDLYDFDSQRSQVRLKVAEIWFSDNETRLQLFERETNSLRLFRYGITEDEAWDKLYQIELHDLKEKILKGDADAEMYTNMDEETLKAQIRETSQQKYELRETQVSTFYKALFTHDGLFELLRDPLPFHSHPYSPIFAQFTEGWYSGIIYDIQDLLQAYNKAFMFREIMLANSGKGVLVVDRGAVNKSGYTVQDISEMWTQIGGVIDLELRGGRRLNDVFQQVTTMSQGLNEITAVMNELERMIYKIIGINDAQLGFVGNEASAAQLRQRIAQGEGTNGIIFDNLYRSLTHHVHHKVIPMLTYDLRSKKPKALRHMGSNRNKWVQLEYGDDFETFSDAIFDGLYETILVQKESDKQIASQNSAMLLELAMARPDAIDIEAAIEFSSMPNKASFLKRNKQLIKKRNRDANLNLVDMQQVQQLMMEHGIDAELANKLLTDMRKARAAEVAQKKQQSGQGLKTIQRLSAESTRQGAIEDSVDRQ